MQLIAPVLNDGRYGVDSTLAGVTAANDTYDLFEKVYLDDRKLGADDLNDAILLGPRAATSIIAAANKAKNLGNELTDLSDSEKELIIATAGERINKPGYIKILKGVLELTDGVSELVNPANPKD